MDNRLGRLGRLLCVAILVGCGADNGGSDGTGSGPSALPTPIGTGARAATATGDGAPAAGQTTAAQGDPVSGAAGSAAALPPADGTEAATTETMGAAGSAAVEPVTQDPAASSPASGPADGDPSAPLVSIPGLDCGPGAPALGLGGANFQIGGRDLRLNYGCKNAGAHMTFILNLHGTMPTEDLKLYQVPYFSAHNYVDSHNLIVVSPKSVVAQWTNGDGGVDEPHLLEIVDWVYANFSDFQITSMWVAGHSWGAMYAKRFVCNAAIADKVRGVVAQAGGGNNPACIDRISHIHTIGENDMGGVLPDQSAAAAAHGCDAVISGPEMVGNNRHRWHANCDPGWVHSDYLMLGKGHIDNIDAEVVQSIVEEIKSTE
ncbi:MAG: hypothetical protein OEZ06_00810 [Myxococcales bacterium]|nr:hypothetical protein [Myxococcales bacterium]